MMYMGKLQRSIETLSHVVTNSPPKKEVPAIDIDCRLEGKKELCTDTKPFPEANKSRHQSTFFFFFFQFTPKIMRLNCGRFRAYLHTHAIPSRVHNLLVRNRKCACFLLVSISMQQSAVRWRGLNEPPNS